MYFLHSSEWFSHSNLHWIHKFVMYFSIIGITLSLKGVIWKDYGRTSKVAGNALLIILIEKLIKKFCNRLENPNFHLWWTTRFPQNSHLIFQIPFWMTEIWVGLYLTRQTGAGGKKDKFLDSGRRWMDWYGTEFASTLELRHTTDLTCICIVSICKLL